MAGPARIVDPHHHLWDLEANPYPWLTRRPLAPNVAGDIAPIARSYRLDDYLADAAGWPLEKSVHVQCGWDPADVVGETRWLQSVADRHGFPHGIVASARLDEPDVEAVLEGHKRFPNVRGVRHIVNWHPDPAKTYVQRPDLLNDERWLAGYRLLRKFDLSFDLQLYPGQMADGAALARAHPDTQVILDHTGMPVDRDEAGLAAWRIGMRALAECPNVAVKISGLGMTDWRWTTDSIRPFVLETIDVFGADRCLFASNFPVDRLYSSFDRLYAAFDEITQGFSADERAALFADNAVRLYRL